MPVAQAAPDAGGAPGAGTGGGERGRRVSSRVTSGTSPAARVVGARGGVLTLANPWPNKMIRLFRGGVYAGTEAGAEATIPTAKGEVVTLLPTGLHTRTPWRVSRCNRHPDDAPK